ncbi:uncharacterized protein V6R79_024606 [Siganus canaliculatus]
MELHSVHRSLHHSHRGQDRHHMLDLNRRLETYLGRVKVLEEENALLAEELQALRRSGHGASTRRKGLEDELRRARLEVDAVWRDRVLTELEVSKLAEELQVLDLQRQREAQAQVQARTKVEQSRRELEEEQRAQIWLKDKVQQLEHEMRHLIQTHQDDVAHMEAAVARSRATMPPTLAQRCSHTPNLLQLGQEYTHMATRAWQEATEGYQGQLAQLEEALNQTRSHLIQANQEKSESQRKLQALETEMCSAQDVRLQLEKTASQRGHEYGRQIQQLEEHLEGLEVEKEELGQQMDQIILENRDLLQAKMSLDLEVATYRALLDGESLRGNASSLKQPGNVSIADAVFSRRGVNTVYQTRLTAGHRTTSLPPPRGTTGSGFTAQTAPPLWSRKPVTRVPETPRSFTKDGHDDDNTTKSAALESPYPKILQDGAEHFRPQEVCETVTYAEPLSPPNEQEVLGEAAEDHSGAEDQSDIPEDGSSVETVVSVQVKSSLGTEPDFDDHDQITPAELTPYHVRLSQETCTTSRESEIPAGPAAGQELQAPVDAGHNGNVEKHEEEEEEEEEASESQTEAVVEPNLESRTSSPMSEYEPEEAIFSRSLGFSQEANISKKEAVEMSAEKPEVEDDKLYPDGEEMDTWDSVIERKVDVKKDEGMKEEEEERQHAEPEEDISTRERRQELAGTKLDLDAGQDLKGPEEKPSPSDPEREPLPDDEDDDAEEDSQNVSVSWRTEVESESYAQDNTVADTRPLIRYKSDETDANTQASHLEESESSEGEQPKKVGEMGTGTWSEDQSKRFGTMEDLCEEMDGAALEEEYDLGYAQTEDRDAVCAPATESAEEMKQEVSEGHFEEETEEGTGEEKVDYDEELDTDRLVEQELENLTTDSFSAHFAQQQNEEVTIPQGETGEEMSEEEEEEEEEEEAEDTNPGETTNHGPEQPQDDLLLTDSSEVQRVAAENREEEDQHNVSMVTHVDVTEARSDFVIRPDEEEVDNLQDFLVPESTASQEQAEALEATEWEVLEKGEESADIYVHHAGGIRTQEEEEELLETSSDSVVAAENDIFEVKNTNGADHSLQDFFSSGLKSDFWASSLQSGATYQPDDACNEAAEQTHQSLGFADSTVWGDLENPHVVNWNSRVDIDSSKALKVINPEQEVKQALGRGVAEGELVHSEDSEDEARSWSSGEEPEVEQEVVRSFQL